MIVGCSETILPISAFEYCGCSTLDLAPLTRSNSEHVQMSGGPVTFIPRGEGQELSL